MFNRNKINNHPSVLSNIIEQIRRRFIYKIPNDIIVLICLFLPSPVYFNLTCTRIYNVIRNHIPRHIKLYGDLHYRWIDYSLTKNKMGAEIKFKSKINKIKKYTDDKYNYIGKLLMQHRVNSFTFAFFDKLPLHILKINNDSIEHISLICCNDFDITGLYNLKTINAVGCSSTLYTNKLDTLHTLKIKDTLPSDFLLLTNITSLKIKYSYRNIDIAPLVHLKQLTFKSYYQIKLGTHTCLEMLNIVNYSWGDPFYFANGNLPNVHTMKLSNAIPINSAHIPNILILKIKHLYTNSIDISFFRKIKELNIKFSDNVSGIEYLSDLQTLSLYSPYDIICTNIFEKITSLQNLEILDNGSDHKFVNINIAHIRAMKSLTIDAGVGFGKLNTGIKKLKILKYNNAPYLFLMYDFPYLEELIIINQDDDLYNVIEIDLIHFPAIKKLELFGHINIFNSSLLQSIENVHIVHL